MLLIKEDLNHVIKVDPPNTITDAWSKNYYKIQSVNLFDNWWYSDNAREKYTNSQRKMARIIEIHKRQNISSKLYLLRKLYSNKLAESGTVVNHITQIMEIVDKRLKLKRNWITEDKINAAPTVGCNRIHLIIEHSLKIL